MRPALWWTFWWLGIAICLAPAFATFQSRDSNYNVAIVTGGGGGYTGQGDILVAVAWSGLRAYSAATRGTKVANVCNPTDATGADCVDWNSDATTGDLVATTINGANCTTVTCDVKVLYDQTGGTACSTGVAVACDFTQITKANRPTLVSNCVTTKWCMNFNGTSASLFTTTPGGIGSGLTLSQPLTLSYVLFHTNVGRQDLSANAGVNFGSTANEAYGAFGNFTPITGITSFDGFWNVMHVVGNGVSGDVHINSTTNTNDLGAAGSASNILCGRNANFFAGKMVECGVWGSAVSAANMNTMSANAHTYWGF